MAMPRPVGTWARGSQWGMHAMPVRAHAHMEDLLIEAS